MKSQLYRLYAEWAISAASSLPMKNTTRERKKRQRLRSLFVRDAGRGIEVEDSSSERVESRISGELWPALQADYRSGVDRVRAWLRNPLRACIEAWRSIRMKFRTSVQVRFVVSLIFAMSAVILIAGVGLTVFMTHQTRAAKEADTLTLLDQSRSRVEQQFNAPISPSADIASILASARASVAERTGAVDEELISSFEVVLFSRSAEGQEIAVPRDDLIPQSLRTVIQEGNVGLEYATVEVTDSATKVLIVGTPLAANVPDAEMYIVQSVVSDEAMMSRFKGMLVTAGLILVVLVLILSFWFSSTLLKPIRQASHTAVHFAGGNFRTRMVVDGEDEIAVLAQSFNDLAEKVSSQIQSLEEFGSLQQRFTSDVSHELRTPITSVRIAADLIQDQAHTFPPDLRRVSELLSSEVDRFSDLLDDLLEISRFDAQKANLSLERVEMQGLIRSAEEQVAVIAQESGTDIIFDLPAESIYAEVDSRRVERILRNLLSNAVDHSLSKPVIVTLRANKQAVAVTVVDHGVGLSASEAEYVFNRFWRADPSRERRTGGTGLGLAISKEDAILHGGRLEVTGEISVGACFRLTLPLTAKEGQELTKESELESPLPLKLHMPLDEECIDEAGAVHTPDITRVKDVSGTEIEHEES